MRTEIQPAHTLNLSRSMHAVHASTASTSMHALNGSSTPATLRHVLRLSDLEDSAWRRIVESAVLFRRAKRAGKPLNGLASGQVGAGKIGRAHV